MTVPVIRTAVDSRALALYVTFLRCCFLCRGVQVRVGVNFGVHLRYREGSEAFPNRSITVSLQAVVDLKGGEMDQSSALLFKSLDLESPAEKLGFIMARTRL